MGWTSTHRPQGVTDRDWFKQDLGNGRTMVASGSRLGEFYAAIREPDGETWALVVLTRWDRNQDFNFSWKDMSESMGPGIDNCPASVLDALTPTTDGYALEWRARARANLDRRATGRAVKNGDVLTFAHPMTFGSGYGQASRFRINKAGRKVTFTALDGTREFRCRITGWRDRAYTVETA